MRMSKRAVGAVTAGAVALGVGAAWAQVGSAPAGASVDQPVGQPVGAPAQPAAGAGEAAELPAPEALFEAHIKAAGGKAAIEAMTTRYLEGIYSGPPFTAPVRIQMWQEAPNLAHVVLTDPLGPKMELGYDGTVAWQRSVEGVVTHLEGQTAIDQIEGSDFYGEVKYAERYKSMKTIGQGTVNDTPVWAVLVESQAGRQRQVLFDARTGLYFGERAPLTVGERQLGVETLVSDYQGVSGVEGVLWPRKQVQQFIGFDGRATMTFRKVEANGERHEFQAPPATPLDAEGKPIRPRVNGDNVSPGRVPQPQTPSGVPSGVDPGVVDPAPATP
jgi:hypothetical protein